MLQNHYDRRFHSARVSRSGYRSLFVRPRAWTLTYAPYVPCARLAKIIQEYIDWLGISRQDLTRELAAATGKSQSCWDRRIYSIMSGESETVRFQTADAILTNLYLVERWYTDLDDIYQKVA